MLTIDLITYSSDNGKKYDFHSVHAELISALTENISLNFIDNKDIDKISDSNLKIIFITSGGVEHKIVADYEMLPHPVIILADGINNSLASAMELMSWIKRKGAKYELLHGNYKEICKRLYYLDKLFHSRNSLNEKKIGVIGAPSPWLVASNVDYLLAQHRWGVNFVDVSLNEVAERFKNINEADSAKVAAEVTGRALAIRDVQPASILKACTLYLAIKQTVKDYKLDAYTINCFDMAKAFNATGCLAIALLNDEGIISGCEGDMQSVFTLLMANTVTGQTGFMGNLLFLEPENVVVFGHNTIGLKQTSQFIIRNHVEIDKGVTIQGIVPESEVTVVKCGNESLDSFFISKGFITENTNYVNACRTQFRVKLDKSTDYFVNNPLGNHHVVIAGDHEKIINDLLLSNSCIRVY